MQTTNKAGYGHYTGCISSNSFTGAAMGIVQLVLGGFIVCCILGLGYAIGFYDAVAEYGRGRQWHDPE